MLVSDRFRRHSLIERIGKIEWVSRISKRE